MANHKSIPTICIVGRPNVGKSSLFNRLLGQRKAVVVEQSGTTRDRVESIIKIGRASFKLVDTGGYLAGGKEVLTEEIQEQIFEAMEEASAIVLVADSIAGVAPEDKEVVSLLRKFSKPIILVANKTDNDTLKRDALEFYQFGFGDPVPVSCLHNRGIRVLRRRIAESVEGEVEDGPAGEKTIRIAVVGRPNVGKSSFVNNLLDRNRVIVSDIPGTTRDSIDTQFSFEDMDYILIDTAGIRHRRKIKKPVDTYSVMRSKDSIMRSDVVVLLLDAADGAVKDDIEILNFIEECGKACLILVNKWDLAEETANVTIEEYEKHLVYASNQLVKFPIAFISALTGKKVLDSLSVVKILDSNLDLKLSTPFLNRIIEKHDPGKLPIPRKKKRPNFLYMTQTSARPLEFTIFVNDPGAVLPSHFSFIENQLRANLPLKGVPVKLKMRKATKKTPKRTFKRGK